MILQIIMASFLASIFQVSMDIWLFTLVANLMQFLEIWETILISIFNIFCNNLEITVILCIFYCK